MIRIENTEIDGFKAAIRGMRNPMNSWDKSDSGWGCNSEGLCKECEYQPDWCGNACQKIVGEKDLDLMKRLVKAGSDHSKFMRMITVTCDITAPLYWWKEFDTYKVGTVRNSCSTMHKIHAKEFELDDFSHEHLSQSDDKICAECGVDLLICLIASLNEFRKAYLETNDKMYWWQMIQLLPSSYNQRATAQLNYSVLRNIYHARKNHKLDEWHTLCDWIEDLPYSELITEVF